MIEVRLKASSTFPWRTTRNVSVRGEWRGTGQDPPPERVEDWIAVLLGAEGSFALLASDSDGGVVAAVDERRSFPFFWAERGSDVLIADDARVALSFARDAAKDPVSTAEALACGLVSGARTLFDGVKQVRAGELLYISAGGTTRIAIHDWSAPTRRFEGEAGDAPRSVRASDRTHRFDELDAVLGGVGERLFESVHGRLVVIPLTGGYDSRLLAVLAKRVGYDRVLCVGSSRVSHWEATIGREVAERLELPYVHFGHEPDQWREWFASPARRDYYRQADDLTALPSMIEWPKLLELRRSGLADDDAVIVSGHFGGFVSGAEEIQDGARTTRDPIERAVSSILWRRYRLNERPSVRTELGRALLERVRAVVAEAPDARAPVEELVDRWERKEYQTKRVGSAVRAYEYFGFEWRLPYFDRELLSFWRQIPSEERFEGRLHHDYVSRVGERWNLPPANPGVVPLSQRRGRRWVKRLGLLTLARAARRFLRRLDGQGITRADGLGWSCLFDPEEVRRTYTGLEGVESYLIREWLEHIES